MIPMEALEAAEQAVVDAMYKYGPDGHIDGYQEIAHAALVAAASLMAAPHILEGEVEWTVFRASDGPSGSPAENLRYSTKAGAQESINTRYGTPELWEPRSRIVGEWTK
jgi:hypothetical protein